MDYEYSFLDQSPLYIACIEGEVQTVLDLLAKESGNERSDLDRFIIIHAAFMTKYEPIVTILLNEWDNINAQDIFSKNILHNAAKKGHVKIVEYLLEKGIKIEQKDDIGQTPLSYAVAHNNVHIVQLLMTKGANIYAQDNNCRTPLHIAALGGDKELVETLLNAGSEAEAKDYHCKTPVFYAVEGNNLPIVEMLIEKGINVNSQDHHGRTPFHIAAIYSNIEVMRKLLTAGTDINHKDSKGETPFLSAVKNSNVAVVEILIGNGIDVNTYDRFGRTPLHVAAANGHKELVEKLLDAGSDVHRENDAGETALFYAASNCYIYDNTFKFYATSDNIKLLLDAGSKINKKNKFGLSPIFHAIKANVYENVEFLLDAGACIDFVVDDAYYPFYAEENVDMVGEGNIMGIKKLLKRHLIQLQTANMRVNECMVEKAFNLVRIECEESSEKSYIFEVEKMKMKRFGRNSIHDVLIKIENPIFSDNTEMEMFINSENLQKEFPYYGTLVNYKFKEAKTRNNLLKFVTCNLKIDVHSNNTVFSLPNEIKREILYYLNMEELENLKMAFHDPIQKKNVLS